MLGYSKMQVPHKDLKKGSQQHISLIINVTRRQQYNIKQQQLNVPKTEPNERRKKNVSTEVEHKNYI